MKPDEKGWLREYLEFRKEMLGELARKEGHKGAHPEQSLYRVLQPTGLMYGQSIGLLRQEAQATWSDKDRLKILLAESLISSSLLYQDHPIKTAEEFYDAILKTLDTVANFYNNIFPELATPSKTIFGRRKSSLEVAEKILDKRIEHTNNHQGNFWTYFFHNSLLFLDVFIYGQWIHTNADRIVADFFRYERDELRFSLVKVIAAAAHANHSLEDEERKLFEYFMQSADLNSERRKEAQVIFDEGIAIDQITLPSENSWILKKFFLEIAILTMWADRKVDDAEELFIAQFCEYLGFREEDQENSSLAIEGFILEHWDELVHLQSKQDFYQVSERYLRRMENLCRKHEGHLLKEITESEDILALIRKARTNELNPEERERVRGGLIMVLNTIPTFTIISLPQQFLTLPLLMKILPRELFAEA